MKELQAELRAKQASIEEMSGSAKNARFKELEVRCKMAEQELARQKELSRMQARRGDRAGASRGRGGRTGHSGEHAPRRRLLRPLLLRRRRSLRREATRAPRPARAQAVEREEMVKALEEAHADEMMQKDVQLNAEKARRNLGSISPATAVL